MRQSRNVLLLLLMIVVSNLVAQDLMVITNSKYASPLLTGNTVGSSITSKSIMFLEPNSIMNLKMGEGYLRQDYYLKAKSQETTAWILLGAGTVIFITGAVGTFARGTRAIIGGLITGDTDVKGGIYPYLMPIGAVADIASIPFFISSANNRKKRMEVSLFSQAFNYKWQ